VDERCVTGLEEFGCEKMESLRYGQNGMGVCREERQSQTVVLKNKKKQKKKKQKKKKKKKKKQKKKKQTKKKKKKKKKKGTCRHFLQWCYLSLFVPCHLKRTALVSPCEVRRTRVCT
jgi:hypothetical protein